MIKGRRVGTFTAGIVLVVIGIVFLLKTFLHNFSLMWIVSLWPVILILLGIEILIAYAINKEEKINYDFSAVILVIMLSMFAISMSGLQFFMEHANTCITLR